MKKERDGTNDAQIREPTIGASIIIALWELVMESTSILLDAHVSNHTVNLASASAYTTA